MLTAGGSHASYWNGPGFKSRLEDRLTEGLRGIAQPLQATAMTAPHNVLIALLKALLTQKRSVCYMLISVLLGTCFRLRISSC